MAAGDTIEADYVVVGAGSAGCVMAARLSEDAGVKVALLEAGGNDNHFWIHVPLGFGKTFADPKVTRPPVALLAAWQSIGGILVDQRQDLYPRPARGLRPLAPTRQSRLVVHRRPAVFQALGKPGAGRRRVSRRRRTARGVGRALHPPALRRLHRSRRAIGLSAQQRLQREGSGGGRLPADHHPERQALVDRRGLSQTGDATAEFARDHPRADGTGDLRGEARRRRGLS